jgi:hypothetical protein
MHVAIVDRAQSIVRSRADAQFASTLMLAALMIGHHFSISALC